MLSLNIYAQATKEYYVVVKENMSIEPTQKSSLPDGSLSLNFDSQELNTFFNSKTVYKYNIAFQGTKSELLKRIYLVSFDEADILNFDDLSMIDFTAEIPNYELLEYPNDFDLEIPAFATNPLDLVRAPLAWEITKGDDPNIMIGIADDNINPNHEDIEDNIFQHIGTSTSNGQHGTRVAGFASIATNNGVSNNYIINTNSSQTEIDISNYSPGNYIVTLVCDGQIVESKYLVKN